jgi:hypothetical protein
MTLAVEEVQNALFHAWAALFIARDWGRGFSPHTAPERPRPGELVGLLSMQERVTSVATSLPIDAPVTGPGYPLRTDWGPSARLVPPQCLLRPLILTIVQKRCRQQPPDLLSLGRAAAGDPGS